MRAVIRGVAAHQDDNGRENAPSDNLQVAPENAQSTQVAPGVLFCHQRAHLAARTATVLSRLAMDRPRSTLGGMWQQVKDRWAGLQDGQRASLVVALTAVIFLLYLTRRTYLR